MAVDSLLNAETTALVVIDLQEKLVPAIDGAESVLANTHKLLELAKILNLRTFVTTQYAKGLGPTVPEIAAATPEKTYDKVCFSCFGRRTTIADRQQPRSARLDNGARGRAAVIVSARVPATRKRAVPGIAGEPAGYYLRPGQRF